MFRSKILIKQRDITDCGAACLASVAAYYRFYMPISMIRINACTDQRGTNILGLIEAAGKMGFLAKGAKGDSESLLKIPIPTIAHVKFSNGLLHYIVIFKISKKYISYMDPSDGKIHRCEVKKFVLFWTGILVLLIPSSDFIQNEKKISNFKRFWHLIKPYRNESLQALIGAILYTLLGLSLSIYVQKIVDQVLVEEDLRLLQLMSIGMLVIMLIQFILSNIKSIIALQTGQKIDIRLILGYYRHLISLPMRFFDTMRTGEILSRISDAVKIRLFVNDVALGLIVNIFILFFSLLLMFFYNTKLALFSLLIIPFYFIIYLISNQFHKRWQRILMEQSAQLENQLVESIDAAATIKRFGLESFTQQKTENKFMHLMQSVYSSSIYGIYIGNTTELFTKIFTVLVLWIGSILVIKHQLSPGELLSFYALIGYFTGPVASLITSNKSIQDALIATDRLFEIIDLEKETDIKYPIHLSNTNLGDIEFKNIYFKYGTRVTVFEDLSLIIQKGKSTAIVGESGSGKSTLLSLIQKLYPLESGVITIGGYDIKQLNIQNLRSLISVVPQNIDLFVGTIIENIAIGVYQPDLKQIHFLSQLLGIDTFINSLPDSYETILSEQGINFSGGQRQRLAIVRALYRNPEILILDEATSNLDAISEQKIQEGLKWFSSNGKTIIIIAHRLSTIKNCDKIIVFKNGKLMEEGNHEFLLSLNGEYSNLIMSNTS